VTHFGLMVLIPGDTDINDSDAVEMAINERLAEYDENKEVPEYDRICYCIGRAAKEAAHTYASQINGTIDDLRIAHRKVVEERGWTYPEQPTEFASDEQKDAFFDELDAYNQKLQALWNEMLKPWEATERAYFETHPLKDAPDPTCQSCFGKGRYTSRYNPKSRWDWWTINGRWEGWDGADQYIVKVTELPADWSVWAIVTEDGEWHEKGQMGYWAMSINKKEPQDWDAERYEVVSGHTNCYAVLIDAHI